MMAEWVNECVFVCVMQILEIIGENQQNLQHD